MGYITRAYGQIQITPPIPWIVIKGTKWMPDGNPNIDVVFVLDETEHVTETEFGTTTVVIKQAIAVEQRHEDEPRNYNIVEHLQELIDCYPGHEFAGRLDCEGDETGDLWRLEVHNRRAVKVTPRIVWPDGSETSPR